MTESLFDIVSARVWRGRQSWHFETIVRRHSAVFKVDIRRDAYDHQSHAIVSKWDGDQWHNVVSNSIGECACASVSYMRDGITVDDFLPDAHRLLETAMLVVGGGE